MKIAFFELKNWEIDHIKKKISNHELKFYEKPLTKENVAEIKDYDAIGVFVFSKITKQIIDKLPNLKLITTMSTGFDHINLDECKKRDIAVCNVPNYGENTVAEHTFGLILSLSRKITEAIERVKIEGEFRCDEKLRGFDLKNKTLGIVGCGNIGKHVARIAKGFEMNVIVYDVKEDKKLAKEIGFEYVKFKELLANSDIISLHAPYNKHTHHMINKDNIKFIKKGAYLINTARGGLIDTMALNKALDDGILAGAGLDVLEEEGIVKEEKEVLSKDVEFDVKTVLRNHVLMKRDNVIITPHNAFNSNEALMRILDTTAENIIAFEKGNIVNSVLKLVKA